MARPTRFQYPGAVYHLMARGDGGKAIFETDEDRVVFVARLGDVCTSHGWRVHAWVLMGNHFHLLLETPQPNLVAGMKWFLGTFSQGWNRARKRHGHVFQGRYKSVPVNSSESDPYYFRIVADYIHLNPARAGLAGGGRGALAAYRWSSLAGYSSGKPPEWQELERVLGAFELARDGRGRRAYVAWLEARAANTGGAIDAASTAALKRGWYLGEEKFRDRLLAMVDRARGVKPGGASRRGGVLREHGERDAERLVVEGSAKLGLPADRKELAKIKKGDGRKAMLAAVIRRHTGASTEWIAKRLAMGTPGSVSRLTGVVRRSTEKTKECEKLGRMLMRGGD
ncbi:transposase [Luteolibacter marinus]|uniref:transposase n=1 Tax=Luteolibacter marinus TaxID=2776705 RepID=UPI001D030596|nr:transposase [Luteolibacter marinus]